MVEARELRQRAQLDPKRDGVAKGVGVVAGPPLPGIPGSFVDSQRLAELYLSALEQCWDIEILLGRHAELLVELGVVGELIVVTGPPGGQWAWGQAIGK